jgi:hypothetical protein
MSLVMQNTKELADGNERRNLLPFFVIDEENAFPGT